MVFVSRSCCKSGPLRTIGQLSHDGIGHDGKVFFKMDSHVVAHV